MAKIVEIPRYVLLGGILTYRYALRPLLMGHCRFYPTCSRYAQQAIERHGAARGSYLALRRILKCHPWHEGGVDEVP